jgi:hypothetical protein
MEGVWPIRGSRHGGPLSVIGQLAVCAVDSSRQACRQPLGYGWYYRHSARLVGWTSAEFATFIRKEAERWGPVVKESGIKYD